MQILKANDCILVAMLDKDAHGIIELQPKVTSIRAAAGFPPFISQSNIERRSREMVGLTFTRKERGQYYTRGLTSKGRKLAEKLLKRLN